MTAADGSSRAPLLAPLAWALLLAACPPSPGAVTITPTTLQVTGSVTGAGASGAFRVRVERPPNDYLVLLVTHSTIGLAGAQLASISDSEVEVRLSFKGPLDLPYGAGPFDDTVNVGICPDSLCDPRLVVGPYPVAVSYRLGVP